MDVNDIGRVASRKRMNFDAEKLKQKLSRETATIIKLKVGQDTAYWDLKERLQQLQGAHERLQQNMVDVQMQHEAASAHYTQELRLRPDTLNKVAGTRGVCDVLEESGARLRRCVARCQADRGALQAAYAQCGARVRLLAAELQRARDAQARQRDDARESAACAAQQVRQLEAAREQLGEARARADERTAACDQHAARLRQADEAAAAMRDEVSRLVRQFDAQTAHMQQTIAHQEAEARSAGAEAASLRRDAAALQVELRRAQDQLADAKNTIDDMKKKEATHVDEINNLEKVINDKNQHEQEMETEITSMKQSVRQLEMEKLEASGKLYQSEQECGALRTALDELTRAAEQLRARHAAQQDAQQAQQDAEAAQRAELSAAVAAKERELDASSGTIARLMTDLTTERDARVRADAALGAARRQHDAEQLAARGLEQQLREATARLERAVQAKDEELRAQVTTILDTRGEKERLQERIQGLQNIVDNIQKEVTSHPKAPKAAADVGEPPELDAGPHVAEARKTRPHTAEPRKPKPRQAEPRKPGPSQAEPRQAEVHRFFSEFISDSDALDPREVRRRFEAWTRGEMSGEMSGEWRDGPLTAKGSNSLAQKRENLEIKERKFFKNKRFDSKPK